MKFFKAKQTLNYCGCNFYDFFASFPLWAIRPIINTYYCDCWADVPEKPPILFIHIPKNAGSSVTEAIYGRSTGHRPAWMYMANSKKKFYDRTSFAVVRNPYDRFCSIFHHYLSSPRLSPWEANVGKTFFSKYSTPDEFAHAIAANSKRRAFFKTLTPSLSQTNWLKVNGKIAVQYLFLFEKMDKLEIFLRNILDDPQFFLPHANASKRHGSWEKELGTEAKQIIKNLYKDDFQLWESLV